MRLVTYSTELNGPAIGLVLDGRVYDVQGLGQMLGLFLPEDMTEFLELGDAGLDALSSLMEYLDVADAPSWLIEQARIWAPVPRPGKVLAVAGNYNSHITEGGGKAVNKSGVTPRFFIKPSTAVIGPGQSILLPRLSQTVDYEAELGVVIGSAGRYIPVEDALDYVAGYTVFNDVSGRSLTIAATREPRPMDDFFDWLNGKWFDTFAAMGPYLVTADQVADPQDLAIRLWVNGELRQEANTGQMIFNVAELIAFISQFVTLEPGDVIATGTVAGVGATTGHYLAAGDVITCAIDGMGELTNTVEVETP
jgi:2-keto-4-pentenoate hydratase/2-oxohepta-3-ene-1,7-dioic acid hydratase in catechol pathway